MLEINAQRSRLHRPKPVSSALMRLRWFAYY
jgi:hypothetical protein